MLIKQYTTSRGLPYSRRWRVLYFDNVIKISISFSKLNVDYFSFSNLLLGYYIPLDRLPYQG